MMKSDLVAPFSRPVLVDTVPSEGQTILVEATSAERDALAAADGLAGIVSLVGRFRLTPERSGGLRVTGSLEARVTQTCTVTLDPFDVDLDEAVEITFLPDKALAAWIAEHGAKIDDIPSPDDEDPPEPIVEGRIDLGAIAAEFMTLGLDPYPRKPGAVFDPGAATADKDPSPFAVLAKLKPEP